MKNLLVRYYGYCLMVCCFIALPAVANIESPGGIALQVLRVIYSDANNQSGASVTVYNTSSESYLMQSSIKSVDFSNGNVDFTTTSDAVIPFIITPPLARLDANSDLTLRIRKTGAGLPDDRESVFFISMRAIPATPEPDENQQSLGVNIVIVSNLKVFYRPKGLKPTAVVEMADKLNFKVSNGKLIVSNPTPYWATFAYLKADEQQFDNAALRLMVPPFGSQDYSLSNNNIKTISWKLIDEDGWDTKIHQQKLL